MFEKVEAEFFIRDMRRIDLDKKYDCYTLPEIQLDSESSDLELQASIVVVSATVKAVLLAPKYPAVSEVKEQFWATVTFRSEKPSYVGVCTHIQGLDESVSP